MIGGSRSSLAVAAAAAAIVAVGGYALRRYFMVVPFPPSRVLPQRRLAEICDQVSSSQSSSLRIAELGQTKAEFAQDQALNSRAFASYLMCEWWLEGVSLPHSTVLRVMDFMGMCVRSVCLHSGGFALSCRNSEEGEMIASCRVAYYNNRTVHGANHNDDDWTTTRGMLNGEIGLPWFALTLLPHKNFFFKRMMRSMKAMELARQTVTSELPEYLYLIHLATDPVKQSTGAGKLLLHTVREIARERQLPVYLETDCPRLRSYYERNGFEVQIEYEVPDEDSPFPVNFGMLHVPPPPL